MCLMRILVAVAAAAAFGLAACTQAETEQASPDAAVGELGQAVEGAGEAVTEAAQETGEAVEGAVNEAAAAVEHATEGDAASH
jgi:hypothetical protein